MPPPNVKISSRNKASLRKRQFASGNKLRNFVPNETHAGTVPCFHCSEPSVACKDGKSMCRKHLDVARGVEYPLPQVIENPIIRVIDRNLAILSAFSAL